MTRTENDLRDALRELEQRADQQGAPSTAAILSRTGDAPPGRSQHAAARRFPRWLPPAAAAAVVAAAAVTAAMLGASQGGPSRRGEPTAGAGPSSVHPAPQHSASPSATSGPTSAAAAILDDAAARLDAAPAWKTPAAHDFFYVRTNQATTWTSVSGTRAGKGHSATVTIYVPGCRHGHIVSSGESGSCTLIGTPHYLADAPTTAAAWDAYLERIGPGAKAADAQGKIIVGVLHEYLTAPSAAAALLRYTASCPGLHTVAVRRVAGEKLVGVTCTSMSNGSYGLAFDAGSHALVGFVPVTTGGRQDYPAEIVRKTGIVPAIGDKP